jgi:hypothetical protein
MGARLDLAGQQFGFWTVIKRSRSRQFRDVAWRCQCVCGTFKDIRGFRLKRGETKHCGCVLRKELLGRHFGRLVVRKYVGLNGNNRYWKCDCVCGGKIIANGNELKRGNTSSCGCWRRERISAKNIRHGLCESPEYRAWTNIKVRCSNPKAANYDDYGGRGIRMCLEWIDDFMAFYTHIGPRPSAKYSVDRIDVNGHYEPGNVRWATGSEQQLNRRPVSEWRKRTA